MKMEARSDGAMQRAGDGTARQAGDGAVGGAAIGDTTSILAQMGVGCRTTSDTVIMSIFTSIG